jgi:hypothetical protein
MQRWTLVIALLAITFLAATPANAFHHHYRYGGCGYGGCGYGGYGYGGCGGGWCGGGPYPFNGWGYRTYGYGYPMYATLPGPYGGVVYAAPGYSVARPVYGPVRTSAAPPLPGVPYRNISPPPGANAAATSPSTQTSASPTAMARRP